MKTTIVLIIILTLLALFYVLFLMPRKAVLEEAIRPNNICVVAGCSGELCVDENEPQTVTPCIWKEIYGCYKNAKCEKQADGKCGFTPDDELKKCLVQYEKLIDVRKK